MDAFRTNLILEERSLIIERGTFPILSFMKSSRRIPRPVDGDECGAGVRGMQSPSSSFLNYPALWAG